jgi:transcriptional regulator GlxA family with amidase domain
MTHRVVLLALDECFASSIAGPLDLFNTANLIARRRNGGPSPVFEWQVLSRDGASVRASNGYRIDVDGGLDQAGGAHVIMIPAFGSPEPDQLLQAVRRQEGLLDWLRSQFEGGAIVAASCSGTFLLGECGLLDDRLATTSWWLAPIFADRYPNVRLDSMCMLTDQDRVVCAGAGMSHLDLTLHLIGRCTGRELARLCAKYTVLDDPRRSQAPYTILHHVRGHDPLVTRAEQWLKTRLRERISIEDMAAHLAVSPRTLVRHFQQSTGGSPRAFVEKVRIEMGKALLENTQLRVGEILDRIGYSDDSIFRRTFRRHTGLPPREYRRRFGIAQSARRST